MNKITFDDYKSAIRTHYEKKKIEDTTGILMNPSPAQLRNLCLILFESSLSNYDEKILKQFLNVNEEESLRKAIEHCEISKFRPIRSFLKGEKDSENMMRIELSAILVDYNPRPYRRYSQEEDTRKINANISSTNDQKVFIIENEVSGVLINKKGISRSKMSNKKMTFILLGLMSLLLISYTIKMLVFPVKACMKWEYNHYVAVDCINDELGIGQISVVVPIDENVMKLTKLDSKLKYKFFKNEKPLIWYYKKNGIIELFNAPGFHPETGKPLKPITNYIIEKYRLNRNN